MSDSLTGQWLNQASEDEAQIILDLDDDPPDSRGTGRVFFPDGSPGTICELTIPNQLDEIEIQTQLNWMPHDRPMVVDTEEIRKMYPKYSFSESAKIGIKRTENGLQIAWETDVDTTGVAELFRGNMEESSLLEAKQMTWPEFKEFALQNKHGSMLFRGQPKPYKLRTAFHRTHRKDLVRYAADDIPTAHKHLTARTNHLFDLDKPLERGAFWNLLQHHGYPTPLLDWTYSPFVAAFFSFRRRKPASESDRSIRILAFDKEKWSKTFRQLDAVNFARPHFSVLEALAVENPRAIPQQAVSMLTNIDDIEGYVLEKERESGEKFMHAIDLDGDLRPNVMAELSLMGITAGSLFPGLDGACEELMGRFFHHQVPAQPSSPVM